MLPGNSQPLKSHFESSVLLSRDLESCEAARRPFSSCVMRTASFAPLDPLCEQPSLIRQSAFGNRNSVLGPAKIFLRLQCRSTTHSRSGNGLFVKAIGHVAGDENAGMFAPDQVFWK